VTHRTTVKDMLTIMPAMLGLHVALGLRYPIVYGGDTIIRLVNFRGILISYQLPLLQLLLHYAMRWFFGPWAIWLLMGALSALAAAGLHALTLEVTQDRRAAWLAAIFFAAHPFILFYSRVPYQEPLLLACCLWGFCYLSHSGTLRGDLLTSLAFGAACLTRYEGWLAAAVASVYRIWRLREEGRMRGRNLIESFLLYGWAPALWLAWNKGLSPGGTFVLQAQFDWALLYRPYFVVKSAVWWTESAIVLMALVGFAVLWMSPRAQPQPRLHACLGIFLLLYLGAMIFSAHGIEPDPVRLVTEREAFVPIAFLLLYAGAGASRLAGETQRILASSALMKCAVPCLALVLVVSLYFSRGFGRIASANSDPDLKTDYQVAQFLAGKQATAVVLARPLPRYQIEDYLRRAEKTGGPEGRKKAEHVLKAVETTPFDYQRVLAYSWLGKERIVSADLFRGIGPAGIEAFFRNRNVEYLVVFSDFTPVEEHERAIVSLYVEDRSAEQEIRNGDKAARIYRVRS